MNELIEEMFQIERELKQARSEGKEDHEMGELYIRSKSNLNKILESHNNQISALDFGLDLFANIKIPPEILRASSLNALKGKITTVDRARVDNFFQTRFGINTTNVEIISIPKMPAHAEAYAAPCGQNEHYVAIPDNLETKFLSYDLLVHEFGHTVEYTERRKDLMNIVFFDFSVLSEAIAHYYQMSYMLEHSTKEERLGMLASVTYAHVFHQCMKIMRKVAPKEREFDRVEIYKDKEFMDIVYAYRDTNVLDNFFTHNKGKDFYNEYTQNQAKRFGVFLALNFIKYKLDITQLFKTKYPKAKIISLEALIGQTNLKSKVLFNFSKMDETITRFVNGELRP